MSKNKFVKKLFVMLSCVCLFGMLLTGCGHEKEVDPPVKEQVYTADFNLDTGDNVSVRVDEDCGYKLVKQEGGFELIEVSQDDTRIASSVTGTFLNDTVANQAAAEFHSQGVYQDMTVDGKNGFSFSGVNDSGIQMYGCIIPCSDDANSFVEIFSTVSEEELQKAVQNVHVSVVD